MAQILHDRRSWRSRQISTLGSSNFLLHWCDEGGSPSGVAHDNVSNVDAVQELCNFLIGLVLEVVSLMLHMHETLSSNYLRHKKAKRAHRKTETIWKMQVLQRFHKHRYLLHQILMQTILICMRFSQLKSYGISKEKTQRGKEEGESWCQTFKRKVYCVETVKQMVARRIKEYSQQQGRAFFATFEISWANIEIEICPFVTVCVNY